MNRVDLEETVTPQGIGTLVKTYRMYRQMILYPNLMSEMRELFLDALGEHRIASCETIRQEAQHVLERMGGEADEEALRDCTDALIDLHFASHFSWEEIENYINLARKKDAFQTLHKIVNTEGVTSLQMKRAVKQFCMIPQGNLYIAPSEAEGVRVALISHFISSQLPFVGIAKHHITIRDIDELIERSYWNRRRSGKIGGKAAGMFLAYKIVLPRLGERDPDLEEYVDIPESYYFNSGTLSDFLDYNRLYSFHSQKYKSRETIEEEYGTMAELFRKASFPPDVVEDFRKFLERVGPHPLILRSSSLLEDNLGYAFSGKYDSVFVANQDDLQTRLNDFIWGLKQVLMSTFSPSAIVYRRDHNLLDFDERMSVLVQKVVGRRFGPYFFPFVGGVAFSRDMYAWTPRIVREEGMARLALGLGTRAVDRVEPDYPRMVPLSHPLLRPEVTTDQIRKYSQKMVDVINLDTRRVESVSYLALFREIEHPDLYDALSVDEGGFLSPPLFRNQKIDIDRSCITFENFLAKTPFVPLMRKILKKLEKAYGRPVDVEFAWDDDKLYILQCRSLALTDHIGKVVLPEDIPEDRVLFTNGRGISNSIVKDIEFIVYVDPRKYARLSSPEERLSIGRVVGAINRILERRRYALFGPARWGTSDITLGVNVGYGDINHTLVLGEIVFEESGSTTEASYGTHFFNDLVEAGIVPLAIYPDQPKVVFREAFLLESPNQLPSLAPDLDRYTSIIHVVHIPSASQGNFLHIFHDGQKQEGMGFLGPPGGEGE